MIIFVFFDFFDSLFGIYPYYMDGRKKSNLGLSNISHILLCKSSKNFQQNILKSYKRKGIRILGKTQKSFCIGKNKK